jgi:hypothetical protein
MRLCEATTGISNPSPEVVQKLQDLHPQPCDFNFDPNILHAMQTNVPERSCREILNITSDRLRKNIRKKGSLKAPGIDGLRYEHLKTLFGQGNPEIPSEEEFAELFTDLIVLICDVRNVPREFSS